MSTDVKAIETRYKGYRFRSRLEARWAVFFDSLGIRWEYEKEGYVTDRGPYLPDFWLPDHNFFVEIKPTAPDSDERAKAKWIQWNVAAIVFCVGVPGNETVSIFCGDTTDGGGGYNEFDAAWAFDTNDRRLPFKLSVDGGRKDRVIWPPDLCGDIGAVNNSSTKGLCVNWRLLEAQESARSARFEHGETPR